MPDPVYNIISTTGPDHNKTFEVEVKVNNLAIGFGKGSTKKEAEMNAAADAIEKLEK